MYSGCMTEWHVVPQNLVFDLATRAGCVPIEIQPDGCAGMPYWVSNTFLFAKPGAARQAWASRFFAHRGVGARLLSRLTPAALRPRSAGP